MARQWQLSIENFKGHKMYGIKNCLAIYAFGIVIAPFRTIGELSNAADRLGFTLLQLLNAEMAGAFIKVMKAGESMKFALLIVATLLFCTNAQAQLRKCVGVDGRVTYSDVMCSTDSTSGTIKNPNGNTLDASGFRQHVQKSNAEKEAEEQRLAAAARQSPPQECKFAYFSIGDEKGKRLSANAKAECLQNNEAKLQGQPTSLEHYTFWNDHHNRKSNSRQAAIAQAQSNVNAWATQKAIKNAVSDSENKIFSCTPNGFGTGLNCR